MNESIAASTSEQLGKKLYSVGGAVSLVHKLSPQLAHYAAKKMFLYPGPVRLTKSEREFLKEGVPLELYSGRFRMQGRRWGQGPSVLLVHGWGSSPARFNEIVEKLCSQGYSVIGFDQPGHGLTGGTFVSLVDIAKAVGDLSKVYGPFQAVVAHSLGALAAGLVCAESKIAEKLVLVSPLTGSDAAVETFGMLTGIEQPVLAGMRVSIENELGIDFRQYNFEKLIGLIREDLLVIHDKDDRLTSAEKSAEWVGKSTDAEFLLTNGLGHRRILRDPEVVEAVAGFLGRARADVRQQMFSDYAL